MPIPEKYLADFEEDEIFHVYNRTNNEEILFKNDENRIFFLRRYKEILAPFVTTFCWSLLPNHFHLLIQVKSTTDIRTYLNHKQDIELTIIEKKYLEKAITISELIEQAFKRFFQSYALAYNKMYSRKGSLFYRPFKRVKIEKDSQFTMTIVYIHANAMKHGLVKDFNDYRWSSWQTIISDQFTLLSREEVIKWFGSLEECIKAHNELAIYYYDCATAIDAKTFQ